MKRYDHTDENTLGGCLLALLPGFVVSAALVVAALLITGGCR